VSFASAGDPAMLTNIAKSELSDSSTRRESSGRKAAIGLENRDLSTRFLIVAARSLRNFASKFGRIALYANERDARPRNWAFSKIRRE